jgi:hypothetical protein
MVVALLWCGASIVFGRGWRELFWTSSEPISVSATVVHRPVGTPKLQVEETRHGFGMMDVDETREHWFTLRNTGDGDLLLRLGATSCKCTLGELDHGKVPPGGQTRVRLVWQPPKPAELFVQGATIHTNDPRRPSVYLSVVGEVRTHLAASPDAFVFPEVPLGESASRQVLVYSQAWQSFLLTAKCDDPSLEVDLRPADQEELARQHAVSGYAVNVVLPAGRPKGVFNARLQLEATPGAGETVKQFELPIHGIVSGRVSVQGPGLETGKKMELGTIWRGQARQHALSIFVRGPHEDLVVDDLQTRPEFIQARVGQREQVSETLARYKLHIELPADAPISHCLGASAGEIRFKTSHEDSPELRIAVEFAVLEKP